MTSTTQDLTPSAAWTRYVGITREEFAYDAVMSLGGEAFTADVASAAVDVHVDSSDHCNDLTTAQEIERVQALLTAHLLDSIFVVTR